MAKRTKRLPSSKRSAPITRFKKFGEVKKLVISRISKLKLRKRYDSAIVFARKKPFTAFFIALGVLLLVIILGSTIFSVKSPKVESRTEPKSVDVLSLYKSPRISVQGEVKKGGVIKIVAQTPGIVNSINATEGTQVTKGTILINLASNYSGANAFTLQRQLAGASYQNAKDSFDTQKDLITKQREVANLQSDNSEELRSITQVSINDTRDLLNLNTNILDAVKSNIQSLQDNNGDPQQILSLQQLLSQIQGGTNQLSGALRANEYQVNLKNPPVGLEGISKDITLRQLDLQEKALKFGLESASIQLKLAQVQESTMYPASPFDSTIQKVHVKVGDNVNPGAPLITLAGGEGDVVIDARVPKEAAEKVSKLEKAIIEVNGKRIELIPSHVSSEATEGQLYSVIFTLPSEYKKFFTDKGYVTVSLPIGESVGTTIPFIPVDSVFQTQDEAFVFVVENNKARAKKVKLGPVTGSYVTVEQGLSAKDLVILNRTVIEGDEVRIR